MDFFYIFMVEYIYTINENLSVMRKKFTLLLAIVVASFTMVSCSSSSDKESVDFTVITDEIFEGKFYPSLALWNSTQGDPSDLFFSFYLNAPDEGSVVRVTIEETAINEKTVVQESADEAGEMIVYPIIKWKYDDLTQMAQGGSVTMTCILEIDGVEVDRINQMVQYRPINECVFAVFDEEEGEWVRFDEMFALYVNEDYPLIDKILQEILSVDRNRQFIDYQGSEQDFVNQLYWVWEYFSNRGTRYSNVVSTSNESEYVATQYVRFIDQVFDNVQANCVDGTAMLASVYRKIGLQTSIVLVPGHAFLAIGFGDVYYLMETTMMGHNTDAITSYTNAVTAINSNEMQRRIDEEDYTLVNIEQARADGIMPIKR